MGALDVVIRVSGLIEARQALGALVQVAENIEESGDWWVGTVVQYSAYLEYGTARMRPHPYFRPALRRAASKIGGADIHEVSPGGVAGLGRQEVVPGREEFTARFSGAPSPAKLGGVTPGGVSPATRANKLGSFEMSPAKRNPPVKRMVAALEGVSPRSFAFLLEREVKEMIRRKGLIDTGNLRASFVAAPSLPRMKAESLQKIDIAAGGTRREDIVNLEA